jgi:hypothetical protein
MIHESMWRRIDKALASRNARRADDITIDDLTVGEIPPIAWLKFYGVIAAGWVLAIALFVIALNLH